MREREKKCVLNGALKPCNLSHDLKGEKKLKKSKLGKANLDGKGRS